MINSTCNLSHLSWIYTCRGKTISSHPTVIPHTYDLYSMQLQYCLSPLSYFLGDMSCFFKTLLVFHEKHKNISYEIYYSKKLATTTCTCRHQQKVISTESGQSAIRKSYIVKWMDIKFDRTEMFSLLIISLQLVTDIIGNNCERFNQDAGWTTCQIHLVWVILYVAVSVTIL